MISIPINLHPFGNSSRERSIAHVLIANRGELMDGSGLWRYRAAVIGDHGIHYVTVDHMRDSGILPLLMAVLVVWEDDHSRGNACTEEDGPIAETARGIFAELDLSFHRPRTMAPPTRGVNG